MRIQDVALPNPLLDAQENGSLVIFPGAGVSMPAPSNFPDFNKLAEDVAQGALIRELNEPVDRFLGRLHADGVTVHERVRRILSDQSSAPNPLHTDLLRLFEAPSKVKLVTTNFDLHFTTAAQSLFNSDTPVEIHSAPALPLGYAFNGIVYLHSSVDKPAERLVLTDADFGRAYLTEGWARRFLQELFSHYTVLFVGYSHNDPVMNYLARGLPPELGSPRRFALTMANDHERWKFLGISPVIYQASAGPNRHSRVGLMVAAWADLCQKGALEHEQKIKGIVELPVSLDTEELDYLHRKLQEAYTTRFFTRYATRPDWLRWIEASDLLRQLFIPGATLEATHRELASWFAEKFVCEYPGDALAVVQRQGQLLHEVLWLEIAACLFRKKPVPTAEILGRWIPILVTYIPARGSRNFLDYILRQLQDPDSDSVSILLFECLTKPQVWLEKDFWRDAKSEGEEVDVEVTAEGHQYWLDQSWQRLFRPGLARFADALLWIVTAHLQHAFLILKSYGKIHGEWDALSFHRDRIENTGAVRNVFDVLIDAARDIIEFYIANDPVKADSLIEMWISSECRLLKRLGTYGVSKNTNWSSDKQIDWLIQKELLYSLGVKPEVLVVLQNSYASASENSRRTVLAKAHEGPSTDDEDIKARRTYDLLNWLNKCAPECHLSKEHLDAFTAARPEFIPREQSDRDFLISEIVRDELQSPATVEELLAKPAEEQIDFLLSFKPSHPLAVPDRDGLIQTTRSAVARSYEWGKGLAQVLETRGLWNSDLWESVLAGWNAADLTEEQWEETLDFLRDNEQVFHKFSYTVANLLTNGIKKSTGAIPAKSLLLSFGVSQKLWATLVNSNEKPRDNSEDWVQVAINHPAGILADFWLHALSRLRKQAADKWTQMPTDYRVFFQSVLTEKEHVAPEFARVILASHLHFFYSCDVTWTVDNLLPVLDMSVDPRRAIQCWHGYLWYGKWLDNLLPKFLPLYEKFYAVVGSQPDRIQERLCQHLAGIACFGSINPMKDSWLMKFIQRVESQLRWHWAAGVHSMLKEMKDTAKQSAWQNWMKQYWQNRIDGIPVPLDSPEAGVMTEWCLYLQPVFPEVVDKICSGPPPEMTHSFLLYELPETSIAERYPSSVAQLLLYLLRKSTAPRYDFDKVGQTFEQLVGHVGPQILREICDELAKLGYADAARLRTLIPDEGSPA